MNRLNPWRFGSATALTAGALNLICAVAVYLFPDGTMNFINSWTHGLDLSIRRSNPSSTLDGLADGFFNITVTGFLIGMLFAHFYNLVGWCPRCRTNTDERSTDGH